MNVAVSLYRSSQGYPGPHLPTQHVHAMQRHSCACAVLQRPCGDPANTCKAEKGLELAQTHIWPETWDVKEKWSEQRFAWAAAS